MRRGIGCPIDGKAFRFIDRGGWPLFVERIPLRLVPGVGIEALRAFQEAEPLQAAKNGLDREHAPEGKLLLPVSIGVVHPGLAVKDVLAAAEPEADSD